MTNNSPHDSHEREERAQSDVMPLHQAVMREMSDPEDGFSPTPVWLLFLFMALAAWAGSYIATHNGGWDTNNYEDEAVASTGPVKVEKADPMVLGAKVFNSCTQCHQQQGQGVPGSYPPLAGSEWVTGRPEILVRILLHGANGPFQVKGATYNSEMPAWAAKLSDERVAAVATYIRNSFGNKAEPVPEQMVASIRKELNGRAALWTEAELKEAAKLLPEAAPTAAPKPAAAR